MKIVIDARFLGPEGTGVGTYVENLVENLVQIDSKNEYVILLKKSNLHLFNPKKYNFRKVEVNAHWYSAKEQILLPKVLYSEKPDLVHFPHFNVPFFWSGNFVVTIHDLTISKYGRSILKNKNYPIYKIKKVLYNLILGKALGSSRKILVPSKFVRDDLIKHFSVPSERIAVTYESANSFFSQTKVDSTGVAGKTLEKYRIKKPYVLTVGNAYPYKNISSVLEALYSLPEDLKLVHVSGRNFFTEELKRKANDLGVGDRFILTGSIPKEDLAILYKNAQVFVFPSLSEGFGLPGLEAMASGCPVLASNIEVFKEIYGDAAVFFDPKNPSDIAKKIEVNSKNNKLRDIQIKKGLKQVKKYSWRKMAEETLEVYNSFQD